jgi:transcriptional regulator with XRE-family HTH domain
MTSLRTLLAFNMKRQRRLLGLSQAKLAEKVGTSTHYIGMIESKKKFPSPEMLERIAAGLEIDSPALFSTRGFPADGDGRTAEGFRELVMNDIARVIALRMKEFAPEGRQPA